MTRQELQLPILRKACQACRAKKIKCDGKTPICRSCLVNSLECVYLHDARGTGNRKKGQSKDDNYNSVSNYRELRRHLRRAKTEEDRSRSAAELIEFHLHAIKEISEPSTLDDADTLVSIAAKHNDNATQVVNFAASPASSYQLQEDAPLENSGSNVQESHTRDGHRNMFIDEQGNFIFNGPSSTYHRRFANWTRGERLKEVDSPKKAKDRETIRAILVANASMQRQREIAHVYERKFDFDDVDGELALHLIELHFNRQHCAYLISYRPAMMESLANNGPYANRLLLNAIYFSSCLYSDRESLRGDPSNLQSIGRCFHERFKQLLTVELQCSTIPTICALLFMGAAMLSTDRKTEGWVYSGIAYRMLVDLGCHLDVEYLNKDNQFSSIDLEIRRRIFWGAYVHDKFQALYYGRPSTLQIHDGYAAKEFLDTYEELEGWQPYCDPLLGEKQQYQPRYTYAISTFMSMIKLAEIAAEILRTIYAVDSINIPREEHKTNLAKLKCELDLWQSTLPKHLHFNPGLDPAPPPHQITPHMLLHTLYILIYRPLLPGGHLYDLNEANRECLTLCFEAALKIYALIKAYRDTFTLKRSPYMLCYCLFTAFAILLQEPLKYKDELVFLYACLADSQRSANHSFQKPVAIMKEWLTRMGIPVSNDGTQTVQSWPNNSLQYIPYSENSTLSSQRGENLSSNGPVLHINGSVESLFNQDDELYNAYVRETFGADRSLSMLSMDNLLSYGIFDNQLYSIL